MLDLLDTPLLAGLSTAADLVTEAEEHALVGAIDATGLTLFRFQVWTGKRLTASLGWHYEFETAMPRRPILFPTGCCRSATAWRASRGPIPKF